MQTTITSDGPVDLVLDLVAPAADVQPRVDAALKKQRSRVQMRGFRPGKAPLDLVRKMYGEPIRQELAQEIVQQAFDTEIRRNPSYRIIGYPMLTALDFQDDGGFTAQLRFGIRPDVKVQPAEAKPYTRLAYEVTAAMLDEELAQQQRRNALVEEAPEGTVLTDEDIAVIDLAALTAEGTVMPDETERGVRVPLDEPRVHELLKGALRGRTAGEEVDVELPHEAQEDGSMKTHPFRIFVRRVERKRLPDLDDAFAQRVSGGQTATMDALREQMTASLTQQWEQRRRDYLEAQVMERLMEANAIPVPASAVEMFLDSMTEQFARENYQGTLPEDFPHAMFRSQNRAEAQRQAHWMLLRDQLMADHTITVENDDIDAFFAQQAGGEIDPAMLRRVYEGQQGAMDMVEQRLLSEKLFAALTKDATYEDKTIDEVQAELTGAQGDETPAAAPKAKRAARKAEATDDPADEAKPKRAAKKTEEADEAAPKRTAKKADDGDETPAAKPARTKKADAADDAPAAEAAPKASRTAKKAADAAPADEPAPKKASAKKADAPADADAPAKPKRTAKKSEG